MCLKILESQHVGENMFLKQSNLGENSDCAVTGCVASGKTIHLSFLLKSLPDGAHVIIKWNKVGEILPHTPLVGIQNYTATVEDEECLWTLNVSLPYVLAILLPSISREMRTYMRTKTCTWMSVAAGFTRRGHGKNPSVHHPMTW